MYEEVVKILTENFDIPEGVNISLNTCILELHLDSIEKLDFIVLLERKLGLEIVDKKFNKLHTIEEVCNYLLSIKHE